jgi:hypothetical protein
MENFYPAIWNVLHDGVIVAVDGAVPGGLRLDISIDYLRKRFDEPGDSIQVFLVGCTRFSYRQSAEEPSTEDLSVIAAQQPEILSASMIDGACEVECSDGVLEVVASDGSVSLDTGRAIALTELIEVADSYWTEWSERARQAREKTL